MYEDKTLVCKECGQEFVFTAGEQEFYAERGFQNEPQRCKACRDARKNAARGPREYFTALAEAAPGGRRFFFCRGSRPPRPAPGKREAFRKNVPVRTPNLHISRLFKDFLLKNIEN